MQFTESTPSSAGTGSRPPSTSPLSYGDVRAITKWEFLCYQDTAAYFFDPHQRAVYPLGADKCHGPMSYRHAVPRDGRTLTGQQFRHAGFAAARPP